MVRSPSTGSGVGARVTQLKELSGDAYSVTPPVPKSAKIELTSDCDLRCTFCSLTRGGRVRGDMPFERFAATASALRAAGVEHLGLFYIGEPFLDDRLADAVRYAKHDCGYPHVFLTTNGVSARPYSVRACIEAGLDSLKFALNWADPQQFQNITGAPGDRIGAAIVNMERARVIRDDVERRTGHRCALSASTLMHDERQWERMREVLEVAKRAVDEHYWLPLVTDAGIPPREERSQRASAERTPCWALFKEAHVTWDGLLSACPLDASARFHMGALDTESFIDAWHSPDFQALRAAHLDRHFAGTVCEKCLAYD